VLTHELPEAGLVSSIQVAEEVAMRPKLPQLKSCVHTYVLQGGGSGLRHCFEESLARAGRSLGDLRVALELGSNEAIKAAVLRGMGVAVLSLYAVRRELRAGQLHALDIEDVRCDREMFGPPNGWRTVG